MVQNEEGTKHRLTVNSVQQNGGNTHCDNSNPPTGRDGSTHCLETGGRRETGSLRVRDFSRQLPDWFCVDNLRWLNIVRTWTRWSEFSIGDLGDWNRSVRDDLEMLGDDPVTVESNLGSQCLSVESVPMSYLGCLGLACLLWDRSGIGLKTSDNAITVV